MAIAAVVHAVRTVQLHHVVLFPLIIGLARRRLTAQRSQTPSASGNSGQHASTSTSATTASAAFTAANPRDGSARYVVPAKTSAAESTSPIRTKNESIACLAANFCSYMYHGRNNMFRTVLFSE